MKYFMMIRSYRGLVLTGIIACCAAFSAMAQAPVKPAAAKPAVAVPPAAAKSALGIIDEFFKKYKEDGTGPAIDFLFGTNKNFTNAVAIGELKLKLDSLRQTLGTYLGKELIAQRSASPSFYFYSVLVKNEIQPIRFTFVFYKPQNEWQLYRFKYDDQMEAELEDAGKINNKHPL